MSLENEKQKYLCVNGLEKFEEKKREEG